jgi:HK97 family phage major capsid protein
MPTIQELKEKLAEIRTWLTTNLKEIMTEEETRAWDSKKAEFEKGEKDLATLESTRENQRKIDERKAFLDGIKVEPRGNDPIKPKIPAEPKSPTGLRVFKNLAEQLRAIKAYTTTGRVDERLNQLMNEERAILGMNVSIDSEGGWAVQTDFSGMMMESAATAGNILPLVDSYPISGNADGVRWVDIDETSVATTVFGGVRVYWASEAAEVTATDPKIVERKLELLKLMGLAYATYELEQDTSFVSDLYTRAFTLAIQREMEACIVAGTGVGKPLGFLNSGAKVTVSKESQQAADKIYWDNLSHMYNRALGEKSKFIWLVHPDCHEQFDFMQFPVGTGGVPVYLQAAAVGTVDTLKGRPVIDSDHCSAIGDLGDINFVDLSQYMMIYKNGIDAASSIHVQFLTAQNCFRFIFRANGMPKKTAALTIKNSSNQRSSFVTLEAR